MKVYRASLAVVAALCVVVAVAAECSCGPKQVRPREAAPTFTAQAVMPNESFEKLSLDDYAGQWLIMFFFPFAFTFVCPTEIVAFSDAVEDLAAMNTAVLGVSTDSHHTHLAWRRTPRSDGGIGHINFPLVGDFSKSISRDYGVLVEDEDDGMNGAALRGLFIIDPRGMVRTVQINDDQVGRSVAEATRLVKAFQFVESHNGEVCPANWQPGDETIIASTDESKAYFQLMAEGEVQEPALRIRANHVREDVRRVCKEVGMAALLPEAVQDISTSSLKVEQIGGGLTNKLFRCDAPSHSTSVLVRWFGENTDTFIDRERERSVMQQLTDQGFGCSVIGFFENGRIESFLDGYSALGPRDFDDEFTITNIAKQMADMHHLFLTGTRTPVLFKTLKRWLKLAMGIKFDDPAMAASLRRLDMEAVAAEVEWFEAEAAKNPSLLVVAHNDLLPANVMRKGDELMLIDFEYADFNPRGFDIGNYFNEFAGTECDFEANYPNFETRSSFYKQYLQAYYGTSDVSDKDILALDAEVGFYSMGSHLFWGVWGVIQQAYSTIPFEYMPYAHNRMAQYHVDKATYLTRRS